ncbi:MAG: tetratricopeptide repeat protein [Candidatus Glassbacteria bacterium]|nr:tetratricopeptide repeat protein [Candidatus Glassbacteria bacterium]
MSLPPAQKYFISGFAIWLTVLGAAALAFLPVLSAGYVQWDDSLLINNLAVRGIGPEHLRKILLPGGGAYQPVRDLHFAVIYLFSGFDPFGYHLSNWLLNLAVAALAFRAGQVLVRRAGLKQQPAGELVPWLTALVFALHPLHVEAVAWMQGNKDLLASVFFLGAFLCWEKSGRQGGGLAGYYVLSLLLFLLALGSKPTAVSFPLVVFAFDMLFPVGKADKDLSVLPRAKTLLPRYLPIVLPAGLLTAYFVFFTGALDASRLNAENFLAIPLILLECYRLILLPVGLTHRYVDPVFISVANPGWWAGIILTAVLIMLAWRSRRKKPLVTFGILWFFICWLPQSNLFPIAIRVADRYVFLSLFGIALAVSAVLVPILQNLRRGSAIYSKVAVAGLLLAILLALGTLSWQRSRVWHDGVSLWSDSVEKYPGHDFYHYGLGEAYLAANNPAAARESYIRAAEISPLNARNWTALAYTWKQEGELEQAETFYLKALSIDNTSYFAVNSLGNIYSQTGRDSLGLEFYQRALSLRPGDYMAAYNLSRLYRRLGRGNSADSLMSRLESGSLPRPVVLLRRGQDFVELGMLDSARVRFQRAVELDRNLAPAWAGLGQVYLLQDSAGKAVETMRHVLTRSAPDWSLLNNMALAFERTQQADSARAYYSRAYQAEPDSVQSAINLAVNLNRSGRREEAVVIMRQVLEHHPDNFPALRNLGNWMALEGHHAEAAGYYQRGLEINPDDVNVHYNLGRLYLQFLNRPSDALHHLRECLRLDPNQPQAAAVGQAVERLESVLENK